MIWPASSGVTVLLCTVGEHYIVGRQWDWHRIGMGWTTGRLDDWTTGPLDRWTAGPLDRKCVYPTAHRAGTDGVDRVLPAVPYLAPVDGLSVGWLVGWLID